ncbi:chromosome segregation protein SMC [Neiella marina]|uniref:Chromosome partition protein Smc n=1 Tax=Neiella holothuriorum TaxID=2870530 RepID=A0ABS7EK57_9GAMM|nr:chromosome segregation protein SMC [Neiella holothuriorum]MBW8192146.1 chromosome segregation protein SMC [Neiella holothuriorum]
MRLKSIKLAGFKSFVDPTTVPFPQSLTAIVGPNGCGKSNIIDAVRWVLGESSAKNLRGDDMTDVIFNGSLERKPVSQASVELVFDNEDGRVAGEFANYAEVSVKRQVTRERQNTYFLNGNKCRRRDITDIFLGTGLGPRSYAIIEQGMISRLIESKPQELRIFIEEAAGISKYKERRRDTENRLRHSRDNLDRLNDVREELGQQLNKLKRQSTAARKYKELKSKERLLKAQLSAIRWLNWQGRHDELATRAGELDVQAEQLQSQSVALQTQQTEQQTELEHQTLRHDTVRQQLFQISNTITRLEQQILHQGQHKQRLQQELMRLSEQLAEQTGFIEEQQEQVAILTEQAEQLQEQEYGIELALDESGLMLEQAEQALQAWQTRYQQQNEGLQQLRQQLQTNKHQQQLHQQQQQSVGQQQQRLQQSQQQLDSEELAAQQHGLVDALDELAMEHEELLLQLEQEQGSAAEASELHRSLQQQKQASAQQQAALQSKLQTLRQWHSSDDELSQSLRQQGIELTSEVVDSLVIEAGCELAVETILGRFGQAWLTPQISAAANSNLPANTCLIDLSNHESVTPNTDSLAAKVQGPSVALQWLSSVKWVASDAELWQTELSSTPFDSVISASGIWLGKGWLLTAESGQGKLAIHAELLRTEQLLDEQQLQIETLTDKLASADEQQQRRQQQLQQTRQRVQQSETEQQQRRAALALVKQQLQSQQQQQTQLQQELAQCDEQLTELELVLAELVEAELMLEEQMAEQDDGHQLLQDERLQSEQNVRNARASRDQLQQQQHQVALQQSTISNQRDSAQQALQRAEAQQQQWLQRQQQLQQEVNVDVDDSDYQAELEQQLEQKIDVEQQAASHSDAIHHAQNQLIDLKQQEQKIINQQSELKAQKDSLLLEQQTASVRAQAATEQLQEMDQPLKVVLDELPAEYSESSWQEQLERLAKSISRLGPINLAAIDEYEQAAERKQYLDQQNDDLMSALDTLESAIRRIDRECRARFKETFDQVNGDLKVLFPKVFGGGAAYLELTDDDMLETGVTIMARPPGKRNATIHLLSGGEKALTALSLVFAIFRLNPAPFCMLDEVDAPLDDANVGRFCNLVREMSESVQFIYISHNKVTMEMAEQLAGVTMHEPGVSRLVSVDVEQAVALAEVS